MVLATYYYTGEKKSGSPEERPTRGSALLSAVQPCESAQSEVDFDISTSVQVSEEDLHYVKEGLELASHTLFQIFCFEQDGTVKVRVTSLTDPDSEMIMGSATGREIEFYTGSAGWVKGTPFLRLRTVIHEYVHVYQHNQLKRGAVTPQAWLLEGFAEYLGYFALAEIGIQDPLAIQWNQSQVSLDRNLPELAELEQYEQFNAAPPSAYSLAYLATYYLLEQVALQDVHDYLGLLNSETSPGNAFESAFGMTTTAFYERFSEWTGNLSKETDYITRDALPARSAPGGSLTLTLKPIQLFHDVQYVIQGDTVAGTNCHIRITSNQGQPILEISSLSDGTGAVFWLFSLPDRAPAGEVELAADCNFDSTVWRATILSTRQQETT